MSNMSERERAEILIALHNIEDRLQEIADNLRAANKEKVEAAQDRVLSGSPLRRRILELCDGTRSVSDIAKTLGKSIQQVSNNITLLQNAGLVKEVRTGKEKRYLRTR